MPDRYTKQERKEYNHAYYQNKKQGLSTPEEIEREKLVQKRYHQRKQLRALFLKEVMPIIDAKIDEFFPLPTIPE